MMRTKGRFLFPLFSVVMTLTFVVAACAPAVQPSPTAQPAAPTSTAPPRPTATLAPGAPTPTPAPPPTATVRPSPTATPLGASAKPVYGDILTQALGSTGVSFDVHTQVSISTQAFVQAAYDGLVRFDPPSQGQKIAPDLAKSWSVSADNLTWTFVLNQGVMFHDGAELTAEDVKFSYERILEKDRKQTPTPIVKGLFSIIDKIETPDKYTVKITTKAPWAGALTAMGNGYARIVSKKVTEANNHSLAKTIVGSGPFMFKEYVPDISGKMVKNPNYWQKGLPYRDGINTSIIADQQTRLAALRAGKLDIYLDSIAFRQLQALKKERPEWPIVEITDNVGGHGFVVNLTKPPFNDVRVRKAIRLAIDDREIYKLLGNPCSMNFNSPMGKTKWGLSQDVLAQRPENKFDNFAARIAEAKRLLADAGFPNGFKTEIMIGEGQYLYGAPLGPDAEAVVIAQELKAIGIDAEIKNRQYPSEFNDWIISKRYELAAYAISYQGYPDPDGMKNNWQTGAGRNYHGLADPAMDVLLEKQSSILDEQARLKAVQDLQTRILDTYAGFYFPVAALCPEGQSGSPVQAWVRDYYSAWSGARYDNRRYDAVWIDPILKSKYLK